MKIYRYVVIGMFMLTACTLGQASDLGGTKHVSANEFKDLVKEAKGNLVDMRTPGEFAAGHIDGAQMIDFYAPTFSKYLNELDKDKPIYIYCRSGNRSSKSIALLRELGFKEIVNLQYGIVDWQRTGFNLVR